MRSKNFSDAREIHRARTDGAARETVALAAPMNAIIFQMHMPRALGSHGARKVERIFADRKWIARVETNSHVRPAALAQRQQLFAAQILMIFKRHAD